MKTIIRSVAAAAITLLASSAAMADEPPTPVAAGAMAGAKDCRFAVPHGWSQYALKWEGGCAEGRADGKGALRATEKGAVNRIFFGSMHGGELSLGVVDSPDGFIAGKFKEGRVIDSSDPSENMKAFEEASAAAKVVSERFKKAGKTASANFYADKAKRLADQME